MESQHRAPEHFLSVPDLTHTYRKVRGYQSPSLMHQVEESLTLKVFFRIAETSLLRFSLRCSGERSRSDVFEPHSSVLFGQRMYWKCRDDKKIGPEQRTTQLPHIQGGVVRKEKVVNGCK